MCVFSVCTYEYTYLCEGYVHVARLIRGDVVACKFCICLSAQLIFPLLPVSQSRLVAAATVRVSCGQSTLYTLSLITIKLCVFSSLSSYQIFWWVCFTNSHKQSNRIITKKREGCWCNERITFMSFLHLFVRVLSYYIAFLQPYITWPVFRHVHNLYQSEFSTECNPVLPLSKSIVFSFP